MDTSDPPPAGGSLHTIITNSLQYHMNEASAILPDERDFVRTWRRRLRDVLNNEKHVFTQFLSRDVNDIEIIQRHNRLLRELGDTLFNPRSEWVRTNIHPIVSTNDILSEIEHDIRMPITVLQGGLHATLTHYTSTIHALFECEERLETKIKVIEKLHEWVHSIAFEGDFTESRALQASILEYVKAVYTRENINVEYVNFCKLFSRFTALRTIVCGLQATDSTGAPICSICTTERITYTVLPCGHTFCNSCCHKQRAQCYICRCTIRDRQRIYFN